MPSQQDRESGPWRQTRLRQDFGRLRSLTYLTYPKSDGHDGGISGQSHLLPRVVFPDAEADHASRDGGDGRTMYRVALLCHMGIMFISRKCTRGRLTSFWNPADRRHPCPTGHIRVSSSARRSCRRSSEDNEHSAKAESYVSACFLPSGQRMDGNAGESVSSWVGDGSISSDTCAPGIGRGVSLSETCSPKSLCSTTLARLALPSTDVQSLYACGHWGSVRKKQHTSAEQNFAVLGGSRRGTGPRLHEEPSAYM